MVDSIIKYVMERLIYKVVNPFVTFYKERLRVTPQCDVYQRCTVPFRIYPQRTEHTQQNKTEHYV